MRKLLLLFLLLFPLLVQAQTERSPYLYIGGYGAYARNNYSADFTSLPGFPSCSPGFTQGLGDGLSAGLLGELPLNDYLRVQARLGYTGFSGSLNVRSRIGNTLDTNQFAAPSLSNVVPVESEHNIETSLPGISFEPSLMIRPLARLSLQAGVSLAMLTASEFSQREVLVSPSYVTFRDGRAFRNAASGEIPAVNPLQVHGLLGIGYELPVGKEIFLSPEMRFLFPFTDISDVNWSASQLQIGMNVKFGLLPAAEAITLRDTVYRRDTVTTLVAGLDRERISLTNRVMTASEEREGDTRRITTTITESYSREIPRRSTLTLSFETAGLNPDGSRSAEPTIVIEETEFEELFPLLPQIYFPEGSAELGSTRQNQITPESAGNFTEAALPSTTLGIYEQTLNIIGLRMKQNPGARITLTGTSSLNGAESGAQLSRQRAETVKNYLQTSWGISPSRIATAARELPQRPSNNKEPEGREENQRVEISSASEEILAPVRKADIIKTANPPQLEIRPKFQSSDGIRDWKLSIAQAGQELRSFSGDSAMPSQLTWSIADEPIPHLDQPVQIRLSATDRLGLSQTEERPLTVRQLTIRKKRFELHEDRRIERFSLILFDFDKADIGAENQRIIDFIRNRIEPNSQVTIAGYADRTGEPEYNRNLALKRSKAVQSALDLADGRVTLKPIGSDVLLFDNDRPEGRAHSRTVQVILETPVTDGK